MKWFDRTPKVVEKFTIVETEKPSPLAETSESHASVDALRGNAGFLWLLRKLRLQGDRLKSELLNSKHTSLEEVYFLQSGIHWCNWLQSQLDFNHTRYLSMRPATASESSIFEELSNSIEKVGAQPQP